MRIDLKGVVVVSGVFEKTVEGIEHFVRKEEEKFSEVVVSSKHVNTIRQVKQLTWRDHRSPNRLRRRT
jgi:hypothetical protein